MIQVLRPIPVERVKLIVFDLDGTLIDSARDLCNSVNAALEHMGRPHLQDEVIASFVGNGAPMLVRRSLAVENGVAPDEVHDEELATAYSFSWPIIGSISSTSRTPMTGFWTRWPRFAACLTAVRDT